MINIMASVFVNIKMEKCMKDILKKEKGVAKELIIINNTQKGRSSMVILEMIK